jgi:UDP-N-acetylglucosamine 2-epimerase (non-hydrolysing)
LLKVLCVFGTRPETIKMAPVVAELSRRSEEFDCRVCVTAQHRGMLDDLLKLFAITPQHDLDVMRQAQTPSYVAAAVLTGLEAVLAQERPDWLLIQGDTTTAMAAALAAFHNRVRVGHIEAGLRTGDKWQPFPEEINRRVADLVTDLYLPPTERGRQNLLAEGVADENIVVTGNTVVDALLDVSSRPFDERDTPLERLPKGGRLVLLTAHRRESFGAPLKSICRAVREIAGAYDDVHVVYPVHPNPEVSGPVHEALGGVPRITLLEPLDYLTLAHLMKRSYLILTDSGGIQEEAPSLGVPVLVLREVTERPEAVEAGTARIVGTDELRIVAEARSLLDDRGEHDRMSRVANPYGDGQASQRIAAALLDRAAVGARADAQGRAR